MAKIAIVYWSLYGHIKKLADAEKEGIEAAGGKVDVYQLPETLPEEVLTKMGAAPKAADIPLLEDPATLEQYDGFLFGIPTRYGRLPAQWATFLDKCGKQWAGGLFHGKMAGAFVSTGSQGGGQEATVMSLMSTLVHLGIIFVPLGYAKAFPILHGRIDEVRGGSPWGAGTFAGPSGARQPTELELELARTQGKAFLETVSKHFGA